MPRWGRRRLPVRRGSVRFLPDERTLELSGDETLLDVAVRAGIPAAHACGGKARCSTCRVLVLDGADRCNPRNAAERAIADQLGLVGDDIRLACQTTVTGDVTVRRLVLDAEDLAIADVRSRTGPVPIGQERSIAVLFADIRGFTAFSEQLLPYDVIHVLRMLFGRTSGVVGDFGGTVTAYLGDGFMAVFGVDDPDTGAERAVRAGLGVLDAADAIRPRLEDSFGHGFEMNVGVHYGQAVVGSIVGGDAQPVLTAIGDTVNLASRIENANKEAGTRMLVSSDTLGQVGERAVVGRNVTLSLSGKTGTYTLHEILGWRG